MSDNKCVCGHPKSSHNPSFAPWHCASTYCPCSEFRPAEETNQVQVEPRQRGLDPESLGKVTRRMFMFETVYERARKSMSLAHYDANLTRSGRAKAIMMQVALIDDALRAGEAAEKRAEAAERWMAAIERIRQAILGCDVLDRHHAFHAGVCVPERVADGVILLKARVAELESAYLLEKERRIAAEKQVAELNSILARYAGQGCP